MCPLACRGTAIASNLRTTRVWPLYGLVNSATTSPSDRWAASFVLDRDCTADQICEAGLQHGTLSPIQGD